MTYQDLLPFTPGPLFEGTTLPLSPLESDLSSKALPHLLAAQKEIISLVPALAPILADTTFHFIDYGNDIFALNQAIWSSHRISDDPPLIRSTRLNACGVMDNQYLSHAFWIASTLHFPPSTSLHVDIINSSQPPHTQVLFQLNKLEAPDEHTRRILFSFEDNTIQPFQDTENVLSELRLMPNSLTLPFCHALFGLLCTNQILQWQTLSDFSSALAELPNS